MPRKDKAKKGGNKSRKGDDDETEYRTLDIRTDSAGRKDSSERVCICCAWLPCCKWSICKCIPWMHIMWYCIMGVGIGILSSGMSMSIEELSQHSYNWALSYCIVPPIFGGFQLLFAFCEVGSNAKTCSKGACGWTMWFLDWACLISNYGLVVMMGVVMMMISTAAAFGYIIAAVCQGGSVGMQALCPVLFMLDSADTLTDMGLGNLCTCKADHSPQLSEGGVCDHRDSDHHMLGWTVEGKFNDMCGNSSLTEGAKYAIAGAIILNCGMVGLLAQHSALRGKMRVLQSQA